MSTILNKQPDYLYPITFIIGLACIAVSLIMNKPIITITTISIPFLIIFILLVFKKPVILFYAVFIINYYVMGLMRYVKIEGISFIMDLLLISTIITIIINSALLKNIKWKRIVNILTISASIWMGYALLEVINPTALFQAWILSRGLIINGLLIAIMAALLCDKYQTIKTLTFIFSILTLTAIMKVLMQKYIGFDYAELQWFNEGANRSTHLLASGTRFFSFFTDAGNFGSNMGCACIIFGITALNVNQTSLKIFYALISLLSLYAMFLSGTRGAIIVPLGGIILYTIICKNIKAAIIGLFSLIFIYIFFAFTMIGQGNPQIRRMRTAFNPSENASLNVRKENQKKLGQYLKNKPFGEGLGLSGGENRKISIRFTTSIPHDSWYVKLWVESGIVGVSIYLAMIYLAIARGAWILMFKIKDPELKGRLSGFLCGIFGLILSAYGNAFWGQYPTYIFAFTGLTIVLCGEYYDKEIKEPLT